MFPRLSAKVVAFVMVGSAFGLAAAGAEPTYIVALGASGIHGKGVLLSEAFPAQLENMLRARAFNIQVINAGVDGDTTTGMLFRMDSVIPAGTKITIVQPGGNDFRSRKHGLSVDQHLANIEAIVGRL
jgi:acyl-CoA thioesterase-1